jgi:hypothetical protein
VTSPSSDETTSHRSRDIMDPEPGQAVTVAMERLRLERGRRFGDVCLGWQLW